MKTFKQEMSTTELNQFRFKVLSGLARGTITTRKAKELLGSKVAASQTEEVCVVEEAREYYRVEGTVSSMAH